MILGFQFYLVTKASTQFHISILKLKISHFPFKLTIIVDNARSPASSPEIITKFRHWSADSLYLTSLVNSPGMRTVYWRFSLNFVYSVVFLSSWSIARRLRPWPENKKKSLEIIVHIFIWITYVCYFQLDRKCPDKSRVGNLRRPYKL